jgi:hypothetical protein
MKPSIFLFAVFLLVPVAAVSSQTASGSSAPQKSSIPVATVMFRTDEPADLKIDGEAIGRIGTDDLLRRKLELGDHLIQATSADGKVHWEKVITLENPYNKIVSIELTPLRLQKAAAEPASQASPQPLPQPSPEASSQQATQPTPQSPSEHVDTTKLQGTWAYDNTQTMASSGVTCTIAAHFTYYILGFAPGMKSSQTLQVSSSDVKCSDVADNMSSGSRYAGSIEETAPGQFEWNQKVVDCNPPSPCPVGDLASGTASLTKDGTLEDGSTQFVKKSDTVPAEILDELRKAAASQAPQSSRPAEP